jgi:hypothetical protein
MGCEFFALLGSKSQGVKSQFLCAFNNAVNVNAVIRIVGICCPAIRFGYFPPLLGVSWLPFLCFPEFTPY